jgi:uncharacterized protein
MYRLDFSNPWVAAVDHARRRIAAGAALLAAVSAFALLMIGAQAGAGLASGHVAPRIVLYLILFGGLIGCALGALAYEARAARPRGRWAVSLAVGLLVGSAALACAVLTSAVAGGAVWNPAPLMLGGAAAAAGLVLVQASAEELFFRGWLQPVLAARWGPWIGLITTSLVFGAGHAVVGASTGLALVNITLAGLLFGLLALRTGGLAAPAAAHWLWNWGEQAVLGALPNPGYDSLGTIFDLDWTGPALWGGGPDALNGSLGVTFSLAVILALLAAAPAAATSPSLAARRSDRARLGTP